MKTLFRQGDVLLARVPALKEEGLAKIDTDPDRVVLALGEVTGHAHAFYLSPEEIIGNVIKKAQLFAKQGARYLKVLEPVSLRHEEHKQIEIPPGWYALPTQVGVDFDRESRKVVD